LPESRKPSEIRALADVREKPRSKRQGFLSEPVVMSQFIERHPTASLWLIAIAQGVTMLCINVVLRVLVS